MTMRLAVETRPLGDAPLIGTELGQIRFTQPILPETDQCVRITFEALEEGHGQRSYNMLKVETLDAVPGDTLIRQRWRMLRTCQKSGNDGRAVQGIMVCNYRLRCGILDVGPTASLGRS
ncbi:hypothetical protein GG681_16585 [Epibacterium sp. SM1969]|uniref:Uncharacterized protein n=1 Tax=Tritonibacter aquimaris TaxID=2663379 RepID=A0A844B4G5_9RHOB|nr:hypothetical protein [Tritonibacter aquimaris]MQY44266.1 hypothetical protein [Tritonibacter aquimaris]